MGRGARFCPPFSGRASSGAPSIISVWPVPVSARKPMPERAPVAPVHVTVHSILVPSIKGGAANKFRAILPIQHSDFARQRWRKQPGRGAAKAASRLSPPPPPLVDLASGSQGPEAFFCSRGYAGNAPGLAIRRLFSYFGGGPYHSF